MPGTKMGKMGDGLFGSSKATNLDLHFVIEAGCCFDWETHLVRLGHLDEAWHKQIINSMQRVT